MINVCWRILTRAKTSRRTSGFHIGWRSLQRGRFVIARAGAASLAELAAFALPAILIPYPYATDDHQTRNAEIFVRANAAFLLPESELSGDLLAKRIRDLLSDPSVLRTMAKQTEALARRNAARLVVETMERYSQPNDAVAA